MKECEQKRNLAFYKRSGEPWTQEQYKAIFEYVGDYGDIDFSITSEELYHKYIFDDGEFIDDLVFMHAWNQQENEPNFKNCKQVAYEDIFNEDGTVKENGWKK